ncbi:hypothetical protein FHR23_002295 [Stakelama sediminis]|uniref:Uncharacterized protein n=1 Tax=Stakelama sediminis TaxID=463200 RepID=A0A840Z0U7_9SPHN|nr:hypothetical protein [Stakelama sediminis]
MKRGKFAVVAYVTASIVLLLGLVFSWVSYRTAGFDCIDSPVPVDFESCLQTYEHSAKLSAVACLIIWMAASLLFIFKRKNP